MKPRTAAIVQSSYIPWKGYFDLIRSADVFILLDDVQFTKRDWRNRNVIQTARGLRWLTIPVATKGRFTQKIQDCVVSDSDWGRAHWNALKTSYGKAPCFKEYGLLFEEIYRTLSEPHLSRINQRFLQTINSILEIPTALHWSTEWGPTPDEPTDRLVALCQAAGATRYLSGPAAKAYLREERFREKGIDVAYMNYDGYPVYPQIHKTFEHHVSILDLIFHHGRRSTEFMKNFSHVA